MITKEFLTKMYNEKDGLTKAVLEYLIDRFDDYTDIAVHINEILSHGCVNGCVSSLIYYSDTLAFYEKHRNEINIMLYDACLEIGSFDLGLLFGTWDESDPLALESHNRNLLAWFGFEETLYRLAMEWEVVI